MENYDFEQKVIALSLKMNYIVRLNSTSSHILHTPRFVKSYASAESEKFLLITSLTKWPTKNSLKPICPTASLAGGLISKPANDLLEFLRPHTGQTDYYILNYILFIHKLQHPP